MWVRKIDSDAIKRYESSKVKFKMTGTIREVQFLVEANKSYAIQNISKDTYLAGNSPGYTGTENIEPKLLYQRTTWIGYNILDK